jgi:TP901 family phage tail tape measure protein
MAFKLTEGYIDLTVHDARFSDVMGNVEGILGRVGRTMDSITHKAKVMFLSTASAAAVSVRTYGTFERAMRRATAVSEATERQFFKMSQMAEEQSKRLNIAAVNAADAFYYLGSAGLSVTEQMQAFVPVITLAKAGVIGAAEAAENMVDTIKGFRMGFDQTGRVADIMTKAVISSNMNFTQLGQTLELVAGVAHIMNNSIEDTVAVIAHMANVGIKASMAGTSLRRALLNLGAPTTAGRKMLASLGVSVYDLEGRMKPFITILGELNEKLRFASEEQRNMAFRVLFGARAISGQVAVFQTGAKALTEYANSLRDSAGATEKVAGKQLVAFLEQMGRIWRQFKMLVRHIGETLAPAFLRLGNLLDEGLIKLTEYVDRHSLRVREVGERMAVYFEYAARIALNFVKYVVPNWRNAWATIRTVVVEQARTMWEIITEGAFLAGRSFIEVFKTVGRSIKDIFVSYFKILWANYGDMSKSAIANVMTGVIYAWERAISAIWNSAPMKKLRSLLSAISKLPGVSIPKRILEHFTGDIGLKLGFEVDKLRSRVWSWVADLYPEELESHKLLRELLVRLGTDWKVTGAKIADDAKQTWSYIAHVHEVTMRGHKVMWERFLESMPDEWKRTHSALLSGMWRELSNIELKYAKMRGWKDIEAERERIKRLPTYEGGPGTTGPVSGKFGFVGIEELWKQFATALSENEMLNEQKNTTKELATANILGRDRNNMLEALPDAIASKLTGLGTVS